MNLEIKTEHLESMIYCAIQNMWIELILTDPDNWEFYYKNGYNYVFNVINKKTKI
jgi:hypothetical protein